MKKRKNKTVLMMTMLEVEIIGEEVVQEEVTVEIEVGVIIEGTIPLITGDLQLKM